MDYCFDGTVKIALGKAHACALMNFSSITSCLGILQKSDIRLVGLAGKGPIRHLHSVLLGDLAQFVCDIIVIPENFFIGL